MDFYSNVILPMYTATNCKIRTHHMIGSSVEGLPYDSS
jgi:hypothetical protein